MYCAMMAEMPELSSPTAQLIRMVPCGFERVWSTKSLAAFDSATRARQCW